ncbi:MAG: L,D-transpeptidase family protein [Hyphomicrobiaceae bacterium]|nr:L,D-transpeptidase family protein [Hyphomicrobiaceae bacterium]MCC0024482.1 L,D-transpeptidase family protein [Hyphomicrobiaceae bacterium]
MKRRTLLAGMAAMGALPASNAYAVSVWDRLRANQITREANNGEASAAALDAISTTEPILSYDTAYNLELAIAKYQALVANGGWESITSEIYNLRIGADRGSVRMLKRFLIGTGDLSPDTRINDTFNGAVDAAVRLFQARHGLNSDGIIGEDTLYAMAVPADYRLNQLRINAARVPAMASQLSDTYTLVNIPAATIEAVENASVIQRHTAVVGRVDRPTPILHSKIYQINFNPYWHVPQSLVEKDLIRYMNEDPEYLTKFNIHAFDGSGREVNPSDINWSTMDAMNYTYRQEPGAENSLGHVKINFHNQYAVYLHDTPSKNLFDENDRFHSSGCVRVENVASLVAWILSGNGGWDEAAIQAVFNSGERLDVDVQRQVPIQTTYITAWANRQGVISFRDDVYQYDANNIINFSS